MALPTGHSVVGGVLSPVLSKACPEQSRRAEGLSKDGLFGEVGPGSWPKDGRRAQAVTHGRAPDRLDGHFRLVQAADVLGEIVLGAMVFVGDDAGFVGETAAADGDVRWGAQGRVNTLGVLGFHPFFHQPGQVGHEAVAQVLVYEVGSRPAQGEDDDSRPLPTVGDPSGGRGDG